MQLFIDSYGAFLHVKDEMFEVKIFNNKQEIKKKIAPSKIKSILLSKGTSLSYESINLALTYNIDILFLEFDGSPIGRIWHSKLGSTTKIRKHQLVASINNVGVEHIKIWISSKINNQIEFLKRLKKHRNEKAKLFDDAIKKITQSKDSILALKANNITEIADSIRGFEGAAGKLYFEILSNILPEEHKFNGRSSRPAKDSFNTFLNYAYGVLYSKIEKALIIAGIDPYLGFLHRDDYNQKSMVYDFIEPYRVYAEETVFKLFSAKKVNKTHTDNITNGYSLNKEGKILLMQSLNQFMDEDKIKYKGKNHFRNNIIQYDAHSFANYLIKKEFNYKEIEKYDLLGNV
jgi:CRISPR-associated protein Cas1